MRLNLGRCSVHRPMLFLNHAHGTGGGGGGGGGGKGGAGKGRVRCMPLEGLA